MGDVPYDAITVTMLENDLPGGHAPGYFAVINNTLPMMQTTWRNDPATFSGFPEFFMAHELAHQWFGQAVGWKNYHEQWLSEGLAQYFAALVARERHGEPAFRDMLKQMRRWAMDESDQGPIFLGYRLGHIRSEPRVFRALVYNKGAMVLHMLRRLVGDQAFFGGLRRYYADNRFKKAGTSDLQKAFEAASGRNLSRFFQQWIFDVDLPRLRVSSTVAGSELVVRVDQTAGVFDVPLTISIQYADGKMVDDVVVVSEATVEKRIPLAGAVRGVEFNQDNGALVTIDRR
jgi:aminopeptidase N